MFTQMTVGGYGLGKRAKKKKNGVTCLSCREMGLICQGHVTIKSHAGPGDSIKTWYFLQP